MIVGPWHLLVVALVVLVVFGAGRLGEIGKGLGQGVRSVKKGLAPGEEPPKRRRSRSERRADADSDPETHAEPEESLRPRRGHEGADETRQRRHVAAKSRAEDDDERS